MPINLAPVMPEKSIVSPIEKSVILGSFAFGVMG
jgi:hypothetical protein